MVNWIYGTLAKLGYVHPLHPIMGHLPLGLIIAAFMFQLYGILFKRPDLFNTVRHCLTLALISWLPTVLLGYMDWQYRYQSQWLHPIVMKIVLGIVLLILLSMLVLPTVKPRSPRVVLVMLTLSLLTVTGIGFYGAELIYKKEIPPQSQSQLITRGSSLFKEHCSSCHLADSTESKIGVGLKGVMKQKTLPISNEPATEDNIRKLLKIPPEGMPSFIDWKEDDVNALIAYLKTL